MMNDAEKTAFEHAQDLWGPEIQIRMLFEELAELQEAVCKHLRGRASVEKVAEEIADVQIVINQLIFLLSADDLVEMFYKKKFQRLLNRLQRNSNTYKRKTPRGGEQCPS